MELTFYDPNIRKDDKPATRNHMLAVMLSDDEFEQIRRKARNAGQPSISTFARTILLENYDSGKNA